MFISTLAYSQDDKLLNIMQAELNREVTEFTKVSQPPYFVAYRVDDEEAAAVASSFGSLTQSDVRRQRKLFVSVRVGDYLIDNTHQGEEPGEMLMNYMHVQETELPLDDNEGVVAAQPLEGHRRRYRQALKAFANVKNVLATKKSEKSTPDFSKEQVEKYYEERAPKVEQSFNKAEWEQKDAAILKVVSW